MDTIVRDATALGVTGIVPLSTAHVAVPGRARQAAGAIARWQRVAVASAKQCGRATVPAVQPVAPLADVLTAWRGERVLICAEPGRVGAGSPDGPGPRPTRALVLVGPEGGWTDEEVELTTAFGARIVSLGPRTLRADLAPAVLLSSLWTSWGW
jgi:16S rRNA (uracil1498-N3)-methyltransferase